MPTFAKLRARVTSEQRTFFDYLWKFRQSHPEWPATHDVYRHHIEKPALTKLLSGSTGALVLQNQSGGHETYELRTLGILCTSNGESYHRWLLRLVNFLRDIFYQPERKELVSHSEIQSALSLSDIETVTLGQILQGFLGMYAYFEPNSSNWKISIPSRELENLPRKGSLESEFTAILDGLAKQQWHIFATERMKALSSNSSIYEAFGVAPADTNHRRYQVFVSSTFDDLKPERQHVMQALLECHCIPVGMELFPAASLNQWKLIQRVIEESDYYLVIVGGRYGSCPPRGGKSYTEREYDYALKLKKPILGFYHDDPDSLPRKFADKDPQAPARLAAFSRKIKRRVCHPWLMPAELGSAVKSAIHDEIHRNPQRGWMRAPAIKHHDLA